MRPSILVKVIMQGANPCRNCELAYDFVLHYAPNNRIDSSVRFESVRIYLNG